MVDRRLRYGVAWVIRRFGFNAEDILSPRKYARFAVQKVGYLLHYLGVPGFRELAFDLYINGPYSPGLADVYYELARRYPGRIRDFANKFSLNEKHLELVRWFMRKRYWWMEIATTMMMIHKRYQQDPGIDFETLYRLVRSAKPWVDKPLAWKVYVELKNKGLIN